MIYYIHGYLSEPNSTKGLLFKEKLNAKPIKYRDCAPEELIISQCINNIKKEINNDRDAVLIGSSLGGFLAAKTALDCKNVKNLILLNPAIIPLDFDLSKIDGLPHRIAKDMLDKRLYGEKIKSKIFIIAGTNDTVVPTRWVVNFAKAQEATVLFLHDDHSLSNNLEKLPSIIGNFLSKKD